MFVRAVVLARASPGLVNINELYADAASSRDFCAWAALVACLCIVGGDADRRRISSESVGFFRIGLVSWHVDSDIND